MQKGEVGRGDLCVCGGGGGRPESLYHDDDIMQAYRARLHKAPVRKGPIGLYQVAL